MEQIRPSDGRRTQRAAIDLNVRGFKVGDRVLADGAFGPIAGEIDVATGLNAVIGSMCVEWRRVWGRIPAGTDEAALIAALKEASAKCSAARVTAEAFYKATEKRLLREHGIK